MTHSPWPQQRSPQAPASCQEIEQLNRCILDNHLVEDHMTFLHARASGERFDGRLIQQSWDASPMPRYRAVALLLRAFENQSLRDEWLVAAVFLLDRSRVPRSKNPSARDVELQVLAAALMALKQSSAEAELDCAIRDIVLKLPGGGAASQARHDKLWKRIVQVEFHMCQQLGYCIAVPTSFELAKWVSVDICTRVADSQPHWSGLEKGYLPAVGQQVQVPQPRFALLVAFLVELGVVHLEASELYGHSAAFTLLAVSAVWLAAHSFGEPPKSCMNFLDTLQRNLHLEALPETMCFRKLVERLQDLWQHPPVNSEVVRKWHCREILLGGPFACPDIQLHLQTHEICQEATPHKSRSVSGLLSEQAEVASGAKAIRRRLRRMDFASNASPPGKSGDTEDKHGLPLESTNEHSSQRSGQHTLPGSASSDGEGTPVPLCTPMVTSKQHWSQPLLPHQRQLHKQQRIMVTDWQMPLRKRLRRLHADKENKPESPPNVRKYNDCTTGKHKVINQGNVCKEG